MMGPARAKSLRIARTSCLCLLLLIVPSVALRADPIRTDDAGDITASFAYGANHSMALTIRSDENGLNADVEPCVSRGLAAGVIFGAGSSSLGGMMEGRMVERLLTNSFNRQQDRIFSSPSGGMINIPVPEPGGCALLGTGLALLAGWTKAKQRL